MSKFQLSRRRLLVLVLVGVVLVGVVLLLVQRGPSATRDAVDPATTPTPSDAGPVSPLPVRSTAVPPPTPGTVDETLAPGPAGPTVAAALDEPVVLEGDVKVSVLGVAASTVEAVGPGDPSGSALVVRVRLDNTSDHEVRVDGAQVSLLYKRGKEVGIPTPGGGQPFVGELEAQKSVEGTYVFAVPDTSQNHVTVLVTYAAGAPVAKFDGAVK